MDKEKAKRIRNAHRAFVQKTMEGATRILVEQTADHVEDSSREKLLGLKFTLNERLETIQKLDETILENTKGRDIEKKVEYSGEFCANVYRILARIDLSLKDAKNSAHVGTSPSFIQGTCNNKMKSKEGANMKPPKLQSWTKVLGTVRA